MPHYLGFPNAGGREAIKLIVKQAWPGAVIGSDAASVSEYVARSGPSDVQARSIARDGVADGRRGDTDARTADHPYFKNDAVIGDHMRRTTCDERDADHPKEQPAHI